jgi:hypothetical protein
MFAENSKVHSLEIFSVEGSNVIGLIEILTAG